METIISDWSRRSRQSLARKGLRIFRFCVMPWKDEREPTIKCCMGGLIDVVQKFITIQDLWTQLMVSQWNSSGIFPRIHHIAALQHRSKSSCQKWAYIYWKDYLHVNVQRHLMEFLRLIRNANLAPSSFLFMREDFHQEDGHSSDLDQKRSGILLLNVNHKDMGHNCRANDVKI